MRLTRSARSATASRGLSIIAAFALIIPSMAAQAVAAQEPTPTDPVEVTTDPSSSPEATPEPATPEAPTPQPTTTAEPSPDALEAVEEAAPTEPATPSNEPEPSATAELETLGAEVGSLDATVEDDTGIVTLAAQDATIRVQKAGVREGLSRDEPASGLQGATFAAYRKGSSTDQNKPSGSPEATCTTDADGECDLLVDSDSSRYLVVETAAPPGWSVIDRIALGAFNASGTNYAYRWNVGVSAGQTTHVPRTSIEDRSAQRWNQRPDPSGDLGRSDYRWANVGDNVELPVEKCGLDIALIFDQSGSIGSKQSQVQDAATDFVDDLTGTPTSIATFTFSTNSPQNSGDSANRPGLVSIADQAGADQVKDTINGFSSAGGGTNWDHALRQVAAASPQYDLAIMLTDGNPTAWRGETGSTSVVNDYDVEEAVHSANWVKELGTRVVAIGFSGQAGGLTATNLSLISGPQQGDPADPAANDDYFLTTFGDLAELLSAIALNNCGGTINVQKRIAPTWAEAQSVPAEPSWPFEAQEPSGFELVTPPSGTTGPNGEPLTFSVNFAQGFLEPDVTILEPDLGSNVLVQDPNGKNASCFINGQQRPDRIQNTSNGFTVSEVKDNEIISCLVVNSPAQLEAKKYNDLDGDGTQDPGEPFLENWTIFLDENNNSLLDPGETSAKTDGAGTVVFDRLDAPAEYRVCEVLQDGWFNTEPGGGAVCTTQRVELQGADDPPAGPALFGNIEAGGFSVTKTVVDETGLVGDAEYTVSIDCGVEGFNPLILTLTDGETESVGPLRFGTECTIEETGPGGATVDIDPTSVVIGAGEQVEVAVTNTYPSGFGAVQKVVNLRPDLPLDLVPAGTAYPVDVTCTYPAASGFPLAGQPIPGFNPFSTTIQSGTPGRPGQPGPAVSFGPLPAGSQCTVEETDDLGATEVGVSPPQPVTIPAGTDPVTVTVTNVYEPSAVAITKVVEGASLPPDTEFVANVTCSDGTDEDVTFTVSTPGIVSNIVQGSTCEVTEVDSQGARAAISPSGPFPVDDDLVEVTITNTFATGGLTITKVVDDGGTGVVPDGTAFTLAVACELGGTSLDGFPTDVTLTTPDSLSTTITDLPVGSECTVTETDDAGATLPPVIAPQQPVTITDSGDGPVSVVVTNVFETSQFEVTKAVDDATGLVPADTEYAVDVFCTYPTAYQASGPIPGYNPFGVRLSDGGSATVGQLPLGAECTIAESDAQGADRIDIDPETVVVGEGQQPVVVEVTNTYLEGVLALRKSVDDGNSGAIASRTPYVLQVRCVYPSDFPVQGPISGFDPLDVTVLSGVGGGPGPAVEVTGLPVGSSCTVSESDPQGATGVQFVPDQPVTITDDTDSPVQVVVTNTYPVGSGQVVKVTDGSLAPELAPEGSPFLVGVTCTYPDDFPDGGSVIPGYDSRILPVSSGSPGQPGAPAAFGPVPLGSQCTVVELDDGGASTVTITPDQPVTITDTQTPVEITVTNTFLPAGLEITKVIDAPAGALIPTDLVYTVAVLCAFNGPSGVETVFDGEVDISLVDPPGPGIVTDLPVGSVCEVTELETHGASSSITPSGTFLVDGEQPVSVDVTVTNTFDVGELTLTKVVDGSMSSLVPDGTQYSVTALCELDGSAIPGYPQEVVLTTPDALSATLTGLPVGTECFASETDTNGAQSPPTFEPPGEEDFQSGLVTIAAEPTEPITISVTNTYPSAFGEVVKVVDGPQSSIAPTTYTVTVRCELPADFPGAPGPVPGFESLRLTIAAGAPGQPGTPVAFGPVPVGSECTVSETDDGGATAVRISPDQPVTVDDAQTPLEITVTNTFDEGGLRITKVVDGPGSAFVPDETQYVVRVWCTFRDTSVLIKEFPLTTDSPVEITDLPVGSECTVTEVGKQGAGDVTYSPDQTVEVTEASTSVDVEVTNSYPAGTAVITKTVDGDLDELVVEGTTFEVAVTCTFPDEFPDDGVIPGYDPKLVEITSGPPGEAGRPTDIGQLPVGAECSVKESDSNGASQTVISPETFTIVKDESVGVEVTNTYNPAALRIIKDVDGPGAGLIPRDTVFTADVECVPPPGNPNPGFAGEVEFGVDDPAIISGQPEGSRCTVTETGTNGASNVSYSPGQAVDLVGENPVSIDITVTNTFPVGGLVVEKKVVGDGAEFIPDGTTFTVAVSCEFAGNPVDGFTGLLVDLSTPDQLSRTLGPLPVGAECAVEETETNGAQGVTITPKEPVTIVDGETPVSVTVTNTFATGQLVVQKVTAGSGAPFLPDGAVFTVQVTCEFAGTPVAGFNQLMVDLTTPDGLTATLGPLPVGAVCTAVETEDQGAQAVVIAPEEPVVIKEGETPVEIRVANVFLTGELVLEKVVDGEGAAFVPAGTVFTAEVSCLYLGQPVEGFTEKAVDLTSPDQLSQTVGPLPIGAECSVEETASNGAQGVVISPDEPVTVLGTEQPPATVTITNTFGVGSLILEKVVDGEGAVFVPEGTIFTAEVSCEFLGEPVEDINPAVVELTTSDGLSQTLGPLPIGAECAVEETETNGAGLATVVPETVTIGGADEPAQVVITNTFATGALVIDKVIVGPTELVQGSFDFAVTCTYLGSDIAPVAARITPPATSTTVEPLPIGAECSVAERAPYGGADGPAQIDPSSVVVGSGEPVTVTATNTFTPATQPPTPPSGLPATGAAGLGPVVLTGASLVASGSLLLAWAMRGRDSRRGPRPARGASRA